MAIDLCGLYTRRKKGSPLIELFSNMTLSLSLSRDGQRYIINVLGGPNINLWEKIISWLCCYYVVVSLTQQLERGRSKIHMYKIFTLSPLCSHPPMASSYGLLGRKQWVDTSCLHSSDSSFGSVKPMQVFLESLHMLMMPPSHC